MFQTEPADRGHHKILLSDVLCAPHTGSGVSKGVKEAWRAGHSLGSRPGFLCGLLVFLEPAPGIPQSLPVGSALPRVPRASHLCYSCTITTFSFSYSFYGRARRLSAGP